MNCCFIKKKRIVPKKVSYLIDDRVSKDITDKYMNERISCGTCHNVFCLHQNLFKLLKVKIIKHT